MKEYTNDQEQWEAIKAWWKGNGKQLIAVIILGLAVSFGYQFWQQHKVQQAEKASVLYDQLVASYADGSPLLFKDIANELENNFRSTPYAGIAALLEAKTAAEKGDLAVALQKSQWAMEHARGDWLRQIARLRAARVLLAQQKPDAALALLQKVDDAGYTPAINLVKGDIYLAQGKTADARTAYQAALQAIPATQPLHADLQMRIEQLPG